MSKFAYFFLYIYIFFVLVRPQEFITVLFDTPILVLALSCSLLGWACSPSNLKNLRQPQLWLVTAMFFWATVSAAFNYGSVSDVAFTSLLKIACLLLVGNLVVSADRIYKVMFLLVASTTIMVINGLDQKYTGVGFTGTTLSQGTRITYVGIMADPNDLGVVLLNSLPIVVLALILRKGFFNRLVTGGLVFFHLFGIYLTNSRGTILGVVSMLGLVSLKRFGMIKTGFASLLLLPVILVLAPSRFSNLSSEEESAQGRVEAWYNGFDMFLYKPFIGVGIGNFAKHNYLTAHNSFILPLAELGLPGYFFWLSAVMLTFVMLWRLMTIDEQAIGLKSNGEMLFKNYEQARQIAYVNFVSLTGVLTAMFFLSRTYFLPFYMILGMTMGLYFGITRQWPDFPKITLKEYFVRLAIWTLGSIIFLWLLVKILL